MLNEVLHVDLNDSIIAYNRAASGSIVQVQRVTLISHTKTAITLSNIHFFGNSLSQLQYNSAVIQFNTTITAIGVTFLNNMGSCIAVKQSVIVLQGRMMFNNNTAYVGAAMFLGCPSDTGQPSFLSLLPNTTITITNNTALYYGGGVAVDPLCHYDSSCFFQGLAQQNSLMYFQDNKAVVAGSTIYGPSVYTCDIVHEINGELSEFTSLFQVEEGYSVNQVVLAPRNSVCFCENNSPNSCSTELQVSVWPGTEFTVSALSTGTLNYTSSSFIRASITNSGDSRGKFGDGKLQEI